MAEHLASQPGGAPDAAPDNIAIDNALLATDASPLDAVTESGSKDVQMTDVTTDQTSQPTLQPPTPVAPPSTPVAPATLSSTSAPPPTSAASPVPARPSSTTPMRGNGEAGSRAASAHPDPPGGFTMPAEAAAHGAPVRQYINSKVTGTLLQGLKLVAKEQPKDPLRVLGEFFLQRSKELEGTAS